MEGMSKPIRTRFAPSPTGFLHIGGVRTALYAYLFAKANDGTFILRLEDTDRERFVEEGIEQIVKSLDWLGLRPDEGVWFEEKPGKHGPYVQSERLPHYREHAQKLIEEGKAYYSHISPEAFQSLREEAIVAKKPFVYKQDMEPEASGSNNGLPIRLKVEPGKTAWNDEVRGEFETDHALIDDFILIKADGFPTYNFANVIDDHLMEISHVIRGDEFISSTVKHALLFDLLGFDRPKWAHQPLILGPDGKKKLSKRDGDVSVLDYQAKGYLPEAVVNFLALIGWNDGTEQELFSMDELVEKFSLERVQKSPAVFDIGRLDWMNGEYIRNKLSQEELIKRLKPFVPAEWMKDPDYFTKVLNLDKERIKKLDEARYIMEIFFEAPKVDQKLLCKKDQPEVVKMWLERASEELEKIEFTHDTVENTLRSLTDKLAVQSSRLFYVLRVALTGRTEAPGLFDIFVTLGKEESLKRLRQVI
jgi:glutamyl-tRNA synthetase